MSSALENKGTRPKQARRDWGKHGDVHNYGQDAQDAQDARLTGKSIPTSRASRGWGGEGKEDELEPLSSLASTLQRNHYINGENI